MFTKLRKYKMRGLVPSEAKGKRGELDFFKNLLIYNNLCGTIQSYMKVLCKIIIFQKAPNI